MVADRVKQQHKAKKRVKNYDVPKERVFSKAKPYKDMLHIDFTRYPNWCKSCIYNDFTNFYADDKHAHDVLSNILKKLLPHIQNNINKIMSMQEKHCHLLRDSSLDKAVVAINSIHGINIEKTTLWQFGVAGGVRIVGIVVSDDFYTLYPLLIDCNHLLSPDKNFNQKDFKRYKHTISD